jgi:hypothetical protein
MDSQVRVHLGRVHACNEAQASRINKISGQDIPNRGHVAEARTLETYCRRPQHRVLLNSVGSTDVFRRFYISADQREEAERLLRAAFPHVCEVRWYGPLSHAAGQALDLQPAEVMEFRIGKRLVASAMTNPLADEMIDTARH